MKLKINIDHLKHKVFKITFKSAQKYAAKKARNETIGLVIYCCILLSIFVSELQNINLKPFN